MACERNRIIENLAAYIESCGVDVNIAKNKAQGNKGFFKARQGLYRIDVSKKLDDDAVIKTLVHEFVHFIHYNYDKTLKSLDFLFDKYNGNADEDLINLTVDSIPKDTIKPIFDEKEKHQKEADFYYNLLKQKFPEIKKGIAFKSLEKDIKGDLKYLLKHDRVKVFSGLSFKIYSIDTLNKDFPAEKSDILTYIKLKSAERKVKRINSRISRLNRYYNSPTELLARSFEYYVTSPARMKNKAKNLYLYYDKIVSENKIPMLTKMIKIFN